MTYIFVEGYDDNIFIDNLINIENYIKIIEYSNKKKEKINGYIKSIQKNKDDYFLLADLDEKDPKIRIQELKKRFKSIDEKKIFFSIQEIESWYLSGISEKLAKQYKVAEKHLKNTENINKEKFEKILKNNKYTIYETKLQILSEFNIKSAKDRNNSFKCFFNNFNWLFS